MGMIFQTRSDTDSHICINSASAYTLSPASLALRKQILPPGILRKAAGYPSPSSIRIKSYSCLPYSPSGIMLCSLLRRLNTTGRPSCSSGTSSLFKKHGIIFSNTIPDARRRISSAFPSLISSGSLRYTGPVSAPAPALSAHSFV